MNKIVRAQYYANEVCNVVQLLAAFVASFIAVVIGVLQIGTDILLTITSISDELLRSVNIDDLKCP